MLTFSVEYIKKINELEDEADLFAGLVSNFIFVNPSLETSCASLFES